MSIASSVSSRIRKACSNYGFWLVIGVLAIINVVLIGLFQVRNRRLGDPDILDARHWYTPEEAWVFFSELGENGRRLYAISEVTLDALFPLTYAAFFIALIVWFVKSGLWAARLVWIPMTGMSADLVENVLLAFLALSFNSEVSSLARVAATASFSKWSLVYASLAISVIAIVSFLLAKVWKWWRGTGIRQ